MAIINTSATNKTQITVDFPDSGSGNVKATLQSKIAISGAEVFQGADVQTGQIYQCTLNASGNVDATAHPSGWFLPTPDATGTAAWVYRFTVTDSAGNPRFLARTTVSWSASPQSLAAILAAAASSETPNSVASLIANKQDKDLDAVDDNIGIFANGETVDSGFSIGDLGGAQTAATIPFTPAGDIEAEFVQAAIEELDTEKSSTLHNHDGDYDVAGLALAVQSNLNDHAAATNAHGIADTSLLLDSGDIGSTVQAFDADLAAIAALAPANDDIQQRKAGVWTNRTMAQLLTDLSAKLSAINALTWAADKLIYLTGTATVATADLTSFARSLLDDANALTARETLGAAPLKMDINAQTGTTYTFVLSDESKVVTGSNSGATTFTIPPNSTVAYTVGTVIGINQVGTGLITVAQGAGVTLRWFGGTGNKALAGQYANAAIRKSDTNTWELVGRLAT